jgi:CubicO group peptidase (beta-lactamase class C family)
MNRLMKLLSLMLIVLCLAAQPQPARADVTDDEVKSILQDRIERAKRSVGIVVGLVDDKGARVITFGKPSLDGKQALDGNSVFEIGSVTKVFTATLLAIMVERGEVNLNDPISKYLPGTVKTPTRDGKEITLLDLATQTSGLPRLPTNFAPKDPKNPYADYSVDQLYSFLSGYTLTRGIGEKYIANLASVLLGTSWPCVPEWITKRWFANASASPAGWRTPKNLRLRCRRVWPRAQSSAEARRNWDLPTLAGAGALRSTVNDMLKFVAANLGLTKSPLLVAMQRAQQSQRETGQPDLSIGLNWHILKKFDSEIIWHNGATGGYHSFIGFDKKNRKGVVVLSNSANDIDDIGRHLLVSQYPLAKLEPPKEHKAIQLDPKIFDAYAGRLSEIRGISHLPVGAATNSSFNHTVKTRPRIFAESSDFFLAVAVSGDFRQRR